MSGSLGMSYMMSSIAFQESLEDHGQIRLTVDGLVSNRRQRFIGEA